MNNGLSIALIVVGAILLFFGIRAADSLSSDLSNFFTDAPTDKAIWMLIGGVAAMVVGLVGLARRERLAH